MLKHVVAVMFALGIWFIVAPAQAQGDVDCNTLAIQTTIKGLDRFCIQEEDSDDYGVTILRQAIAVVTAESNVTFIYEKAENGDLPSDSINSLAANLLDEEAKMDTAPVTIAGYEVLRFWQPSGNNPDVPCDGAFFVRSASASERIYGMTCRDGAQTPSPLSDDALAEIFSATTTPF